ncbi:MAG: hypothetical protein A2X61_16580 [Ignavibacteria bacterium GWB2_35_12]|nr:MAG: hypothetical protein A2X63_14105 [Ignavibacteria bacterium GWA2_35_8]OGU37895.1 MAG: hypothetical protein A2X61_16580 [Ignavibacteria bacterium GWB2_35_12]OGU85816.1 MAG: hypothetical protein A2220_02230 [Ignavibacteria bacterium RIFOXYA2_FULL_35_10]OGV19681.1 MAG: hypothetical protein A2475_09990 [Ignavibacteria bacterium RIFOXYC2_FULL_35_21]
MNSMYENIQLLIVDDELDFLDTITERMELRGFVVTKAPNGEAALEAVKTKKYDIAILDLKMPGLDGKKVLEILKREHTNIEVVILTADGSSDVAEETSKLGAFCVITKPIDIEKLISVIILAYESRLKKDSGFLKQDFEIVS